MTTERIDTDITRMFNLGVPIIGAPMFLVSREKLVAAVSNAGGLGCFPSLNYRTNEEFRAALANVRALVGDKPIGVNLIARDTNEATNPRLYEDIAACVDAKVALIVTSLGNPAPIIAKVRPHGIKVFCDVINLKHALKVKSAGADGLIAVCAGAGGHAGATSPFVLVPWLVKETALPVVAGGGIGTGGQMLAAFALGAGAVYMGTRFIATPEADAQDEYKQMMIDCSPDDIVYTNKVSGFNANFMKPSVDAQFGKGSAWKDIWSAGHGIAQIDKVESVATIIDRMLREYGEARARVLSLSPNPSPLRGEGQGVRVP
jgi:nitronate monooxygenase